MSHRTSGGFTLLELLIAMALSALLVALLSQALGSLQAAARNASAGQNIADSDQLGRAMLTRLIGNAVPPLPRKDSHAFEGSPQAAEFTATPPQALSDRGLIRVRLSVAPTTPNELGVFAELSPVDGSGGWPRQLLIGGLQFAKLEYTDDASSDLSERWTDKRRLPSFVRLHTQATKEPGQPRVQSVTVRRTLAAACRLDLDNLYCRSTDGY